MADPRYIASGELYEANAALCEFAGRWNMDGDYIRCRKCDRAQLTNYAHFQFQHARDCAVASTSDPHPWVTFVRLVTPIIEAVEKAEKAAPHG
ncbi:hypothetical protein I5V61_12385 [Stenotrophomonas maltophilia]|uniref:hypothetical protein n=1 Tax=Stenotrophomonas geniculata TaxID=86188 RepID=UPI0018D31AFC|nr:hypothetical protein [Stenotrophomonas maltophilia]